MHGNIISKLFTTFVDFGRQFSLFSYVERLKLVVQIYTELAGHVLHKHFDNIGKKCMETGNLKFRLLIIYEQTSVPFS